MVNPLRIVLTDFSKGYRTLYNGKRDYIISSPAELRQLAKEKTGTTFISNFAVDKKGIRHLLFIYYDWDTKDKEVRREIANAILKLRKKRIAYLLQETRRGYHLIIPVDGGITKDAKLILRSALGIRLDDKQCAGRVFGKIRLPYSTYDDGTKVRVVENREGKPLPPLSFERPKRSTPTRPFLCPGIMEDLLTDNPTHFARFTLTAYLHSKGFHPLDIYFIFKALGMRDFDPNYTKYQIEHITSNGYVPPSCETLMSYGYCTPQCPFRRGVKGDDDETDKAH